MGSQEAVLKETRDIMAEEGILSKEEMEEIGLEPDQVKVLKGCFDGFADEDGAIPADNVGGILSMMGMKVKPSLSKKSLKKSMKMVLGFWSLVNSVNLRQNFLLKKMMKL